MPKCARMNVADARMVPMARRTTASAVRIAATAAHRASQHSVAQASALMQSQAKVTEIERDHHHPPDGGVADSAT
jgi:hypothetical protein